MTSQPSRSADETTPSPATRPPLGTGSAWGDRFVAAADYASDPQFFLSCCGAIAAAVAVIEVEGDRFSYSAMHRAYAELLGVWAEGAVGKPLPQVLSAAVAAALQQRYRDCVRAIAPVSYEEHCPITPSWWLITLTPLQNPQGQVCRIVETRTNITPLKQAELALREQWQRLSLHDDFLTSISHELRAPMSGISLAAQTVERVLRQNGFFSRPDETVARALQLLQSECQRQIRLLDHLLALSHARGDDTPRLEAIDLESWLPELVEPFRPRIQSQQQQLQTAIAPQLPPLKTDRAYLERILNELLNNACKYTPAGETITLAADATPTQLQISVRNSGIEIAPEQTAHLFERFDRVPTHAAGEMDGAGLGLMVVQKLAERLGASVQISTAPNSTTVAVRFQRSP